MTNVGYGWLTPPRMDEKDPNRRIATCDLNGIRHFLCPTTGGDYMKCLDCKSIRTCTAGQRAMVLLDAETKAQEKPKQPTPHNDQSDRDCFLEACESGSVMGWLIGRGYSESAAWDKVVYWVKHYPDITRRFDKKQIMRKPRKVTITTLSGEKLEAVNAEIAPVSPKIAPELTLDERVKEIIDEFMNEPREGKTEQKKRDGKNAAKATSARVEKTRAKVREAIATGDPVQWLVDQGMNRKQAVTDLSRWRKNYPDLFEGVVLPKRPSNPKAIPDEEQRALYEECMRHESPAGYYAELKGIQIRSATNKIAQWRKKFGEITVTEEKPMAMVDDQDEMSLADFLAEFADFSEPAPAEPEPKKEPKKVEPEGTWIGKENANRELAYLMEREAGLLKQIAQLQDEVWGIRARRKEIEKKMSH